MPYSTTGNLWPHAALVTISFEPDGTNLGGVSSNLFSTFNPRFGSASTWQNVILRAAQLWAQQTNLNFTVVTDSGAPSGSGSYQQGDATFGDIRIGGYNFGSSNLAMAYFPPPGNNYSLAGDFAFNTGKTFNINGSDYDLFTVALHEFGHSLGLGHSTLTSAVMYPTYNGKHTSLSTDDINGIRSIYGGPRVSDSYDATAPNNSFSSASVITSTISTTTMNALIANQDITTTSDVDYYKFTVPAGMTGTLTAAVQSSGLSFLTPVLKIYKSNQSQLGPTVSGSGYSGSTIQGTASVTAGSAYYVVVSGKDTTANGTGRYTLSLTFSGGTPPPVGLPNMQTPNGSPISGSGGIADVPNGGGFHKGGNMDALAIDPTYQTTPPGSNGNPANPSGQWIIGPPSVPGDSGDQPPASFLVSAPAGQWPPLWLTCPGPASVWVLSDDASDGDVSLALAQ
jgi:hypothetical protein